MFFNSPAAKGRVMKIFLHALLFSAVNLVMFLALLYFGPSIERKLWPVISQTQALIMPHTAADTKEDGIHLLITTTKIRNCKLEDRLVAVKVGQFWVRGVIYFKDPFTGERVTSRPSRPMNQTFADELFILPAGNRIIIDLVHQCHPLWFSTTDLIDLEVK